MRLSVCLRCLTVFLFKEIDEMICVFVAHLQGNLMYLFFCGEKEVFSGLQSLSVEISERRQAESRGIFATDPVFTHMKTLLQIVQSEGVCESMIQIVLQLF